MGKSHHFRNFALARLTRLSIVSGVDVHVLVNPVELARKPCESMK